MFPTNPVDGQLHTDISSGITYRWTVDVNSPPESITGRWIVIGSPQNTLDEEFLRLDTTNGPLTGTLEVTGSIDINARTVNSFRTPPTKGNDGDFLISRGDGTTVWGSISLLPTLP